jgi:hypothetical protein
MSKRLMNHLSRKMSRNTTATPADMETRAVTLTRSELNFVVKWFEGTLSDHERHMHPAEVAHMRKIIKKVKAGA